MKLISLMALLSLSLTACNDQHDITQTLQKAVAIENSDECHLCGMIINQFPGPKGELYQQLQKSVRKFCSTRDLFSYYLQPENKSSTQSIFVHDMAVSPWEKPSFESLIDARNAWYVINHKRQGAMGSTLASFKEKENAALFSKEYGGEILHFDQITLEILYPKATTLNTIKP